MSSNSEFKLRFALPGTLGMRLGGGVRTAASESVARRAPPTRGGMARILRTTELLRAGASSTPESPRAIRHARNRLPCRVSVSISDIFSTMPRSVCCKDTMQLAAGSPRATLRRHRKGRPTQARATGCRRDDGLPRGTTGKSTRGAQGTSPWTGTRTPDSPRQCRGHVPIRHESSGPLDRNMIRRCRRPVFVSRWSGSRTPHCFVRIRGVFRGAGTTP